MLLLIRNYQIQQARNQLWSNKLADSHFFRTGHSVIECPPALHGQARPSISDFRLKYETRSMYLLLLLEEKDLRVHPNSRENGNPIILTSFTCESRFLSNGKYEAGEPPRSGGWSGWSTLDQGSEITWRPKYASLSFISHSELTVIFNSHYYFLYLT